MIVFLKPGNKESFFKFLLVFLCVFGIAETRTKKKKIKLNFGFLGEFECVEKTKRIVFCVFSSRVSFLGFRMPPGL